MSCHDAVYAEPTAMVQTQLSSSRHLTSHDSTSTVGSMKFFGRHRELKVLEDTLAASGSAFVPLYGRRRVGKSALLLQFLKQRRGIYFVGKQAPAGLQRKEFLEVAARALDEPLFAEMTLDSWGRALELLVTRWRGPDKLIIVLDEFQWMVEESPELPSVLQELWDRAWRSSGQVILILCGSYVGFMEREVLGRKSPLFGRRTAQIQLRPFGYRESREFHSQYSLSDAACSYFVCGGIPQYLLSFESGSSFEMNLKRQVLSEFAPLYNEPDFLLREELRDLHNYHAILTALASGSAPSPELARRTGIAERSVSYYLTQLVELGYLRRRYPLTDSPRLARHVRYTLDDPLLRFWFRFVFPNRSSLAQLGPDEGFRQLVKPQLEAFFGRCFELLCQEAMPWLYQRGRIETAFEIGEYWDKQMQIDLVGLRADHWTDLGECKWGPVSSLPKLAQELERKVGSYPNKRNATIGRHLFVRTRPRKNQIAGVQIHDLEDLYDGATAPGGERPD